MTDWPHAIDEALAGYALTSPVRGHRLVSLSENATYLVDLVDGTTVAVRLHRPGFRSPAEIHSELAWINALREDRVVATPGIIPDRNGQQLHRFEAHDGSRFAVMFEFVPGCSPRIEDEDSLLRSFRTIGAITRRMHRHAASWRPPAGFERVTWSPEFILGIDSSWESWRLNPEVSGSTAVALGEVEAAALSLLHRYRRLHPDRFGLIHTDLRTANLLVERDRLTVIDFDDCGFGFPMWDLAGALSFIEAEPVVPALVHAWIDGYGGVDAADLRVIPALIMLRRLQLVGWMNTREGTAEHRRMVGVYVPETVRIGREFLRGAFALEDRVAS